MVSELTVLIIDVFSYWCHL